MSNKKNKNKENVLPGSPRHKRKPLSYSIQIRELSPKTVRRFFSHRLRSTVSADTQQLEDNTFNISINIFYNRKGVSEPHV